MPAERQSCRLLITAGPTQEPIDAVRYIGNRSSGRMGIALAGAALDRDIDTTLLLGPTPLAPPERTEKSTRFRLERFRTTDDLRDALARHWPDHDTLIMAAAVADYRPVRTATTGDDTKLPRGARNLTLELEPTEDLVAALAARARADQTIVGFALEPAETLRAAAQRKLLAKGLDAIVANPLETMDAPRVTASLHFASGAVLSPPADIDKAEFAEWLLDQLRLHTAAVGRVSG